METQINSIEGSWIRVKNACRTTVNKEHTDNIPTSSFKSSLLISEHSPIRLLKINWIWKNIKSWIATHWSRHKWECFISTQRTDRTGIDRDNEPQGAFVIFEGEANAQHLIDTWRKRLCFQASPETRKLAEDFKQVLKSTEPKLADVLVPNCIYRCGCPEFNECGYWSSFVEKYSNNQLINEFYSKDLLNIKNRYALYNNQFYIKNKFDSVFDIMKY